MPDQKIQFEKEISTEVGFSIVGSYSGLHKGFDETMNKIAEMAVLIFQSEEFSTAYKAALKK